MKVAAYCRVSTEKADQRHSFLAQQAFFREFIQNHPDWELYGIYADEGITGTSIKGRSQFLRMLNDAKSGMFHKIITREVSRFSRNLLDTIYYTRELKHYGVSVVFLSDGIDTRDADAELRLSIKASIAQEESRRTSQRVTWGQTRQMEKGIVFGRSLLGYRLENGKLSVNPREAEIVREIFHMYTVDQLSAKQIAEILTRSEMKTHRNNPKWSSSSILKILKNEKYVGDLVQKKTYTPDYLTHEKRSNRGDIPLIVIPDHHEAIIDRNQWQQAQTRLHQNNRHSRSQALRSHMHPFSGKIRCGKCGAVFTAGYRYRKDGGKTLRWRCSGNCGIGKMLSDADAMSMSRDALKSLSRSEDLLSLTNIRVMRKLVQDITVYPDSRFILRLCSLDYAFLFHP